MIEFGTQPALSAVNASKEPGPGVKCRQLTAKHIYTALSKSVPLPKYFNLSLLFVSHTILFFSPALKILPDRLRSRTLSRHNLVFLIFSDTNCEKFLSPMGAAIQVLF
jgi:hypothetical protein